MKRMTNIPGRHPELALMRQAFGPGFQAGGPSDRTLRLLSTPRRRPNR